VLAEHRLQLILSILGKRGSAKISELCRETGVSRETIRRDLARLAEQRQLRQTHGGAFSLKLTEPAIDDRRVTNPDGKRAIGLIAASLIPDGASVILDSGTTMNAVADALTNRHGLTVYTNDLGIAAKMIAADGENRVHVLGGQVLQGNENATMGSDTVEMLSHYFANFAVVGVSAISPEPWLMDFDRAFSELRGLMLVSATTSVLVGDHTKFNRYAPVKVPNFDRASYLVTDSELDPIMISSLERMPMRVLVAARGGGDVS
jgi:DeoR family transcriptional regulator, glycerol-3-phosphate regulon repressor